MDTKDLPKTRAEAKRIGSKYYFTGEPCKHGHIAPRKTKGSCLECLKLEWERGNETRAEYFRAYNKSESGQQSKQAYYERNKEQVKAKAKARDTAVVSRYKAMHKERNPEYYKSLVNARRRRFRQATPKWLTAEDKLEIRLRYRLAIELTRRTRIQYVVDHIVPLQGESVCGLHVPWNMEVITQEENLLKSNKLVDPATNTVHNA
jgi:5-methylcytosine-specific restriction endonuclease McrA